MLEWNVFVSDIYSSKITVFNLFDHYGFVYGCEDILKNTNISKEEFALDVQKELLYFFRGKSEWEIILKPVFSLGELFENRIDVYSQVWLNYESFINYVWNNKNELLNG